MRHQACPSPPDLLRAGVRSGVGASSAPCTARALCSRGVRLVGRWTLLKQGRWLGQGAVTAGPAIAAQWLRFSSRPPADLVFPASPARMRFQIFLTESYVAPWGWDVSLGDGDPSGVPCPPAQGRRLGKAGAPPAAAPGQGGPAAPGRRRRQRPAAAEGGGAARAGRGRARMRAAGRGRRRGAGRGAAAPAWRGQAGADGGWAWRGAARGPSFPSLPPWPCPPPPPPPPPAAQKMASPCGRQQCSIERRGVRHQLDSWRHKLIHCVGEGRRRGGEAGPGPAVVVVVAAAAGGRLRRRGAVRRAAPRPAGPPPSPRRCGPPWGEWRRAGPRPSPGREPGGGSCPALLCGPCQRRACSSPPGPAAAPSNLFTAGLGPRPPAGSGRAVTAHPPPREARRAWPGPSAPARRREARRARGGRPRKPALAPPPWAPAGEAPGGVSGWGTRWRGRRKVAGRVPDRRRGSGAGPWGLKGCVIAFLFSPPPLFFFFTPSLWCAFVVMEAPCNQIFGVFEKEVPNMFSSRITFSIQNTDFCPFLFP